MASYKHFDFGMTLQYGSLDCFYSTALRRAIYPIWNGVHVMTWHDATRQKTIEPIRYYNNYNKKMDVVKCDMTKSHLLCGVRGKDLCVSRQAAAAVI